MLEFTDPFGHGCSNDGQTSQSVAPTPLPYMTTLVSSGSEPALDPAGVSLLSSPRPGSPGSAFVADQKKLDIFPSAAEPAAAENRSTTLCFDDDDDGPGRPGSPNHPAGQTAPSGYAGKGQTSKTKSGRGLRLSLVSRRLMVGAYALAVAATAAHYAFLFAMAGREVGNVLRQQETRFVANFIPYVVQMALVVSIDVALNQWLFLRLRNRAVSIKCLDAAYSASSSLLFLLTSDMYRMLPDVLLLAVVLAAMTVPTTMVTPGTLYVVPGQKAVTQVLPVPRLDMGSNNVTQSRQFQVSRATNGEVNSASDTAYVFGGPRTILTRLSTAAGATGAILPMSRMPSVSASAPAVAAVNATYAVEFDGPYVRCETANDTVAQWIDAAAAALAKKPVTVTTADGTNSTTASLVYGGYFAYVPDLSEAAAVSNTTGTPTARSSDAARGSNEIWLSFRSNSTGWTMDPFPRCPVVEHRVCRLFNASYALNVTYANGQLLVDHRVAAIGAAPVPYPDAVANISDPHMPGFMSYSAYMWAFTDLLTGSLSLYEGDDEALGSNTAGGDAAAAANSSFYYSMIRSNIENTALLGSSDLNCFFAVDWLFDNDTWQPSSPQRQHDIDFASAGQTLDALVPQLSANLTISLMNDDLLGPPQPANVTVFQAVDRYAFHASTLLAAYGAALAAGLVAIAMGLVAFARNDMRIDRSFSSTASATHHTHLVDAAHYRRRGSVPLPRPVREKRVMFRPLSQADGGGWGFVVVDGTEEQKPRG